MKYRVIKFFTDLQDNNYAYHVGDTFPHKGMIVSNIRLKELSTSNNRQHTPLIAIVEEDEPEVKAEVAAEVEAEAETKKATRKKK